jgi:hypothetical protein
MEVTQELVAISMSEALGARGSAVGEALGHKPEDLGFESR